MSSGNREFPRPGSGSGVPLEDRVRDLELNYARTEQRLHQGAQTFSELRSRQVELENNSPHRLLSKIVWGFVGVIFAGGVAFGTLQATKTERSDVKELIMDVSPYRDDQQKIDRVVRRYDGDQATINEKLTAIEKQLSGIDAKLEKLTEPRRRRR